jgi:pSer/pThr/pTyr-binding forkhead associated (FHA) protein
MPSIHIINQDGRIYNFPIVKKKTTIGRSKDNDIVLSDSRVSNYHAIIIAQEKNYLLTDLGSHNGTKINEKFVNKSTLKHDDEIKIGNSKLTFLTKEKTSPSLLDTFSLAKESEYEKWHQQTVKISPADSCQEDSRTLLVSPEPEKGPGEGFFSFLSKKKRRVTKIKSDLLPSERALSMILTNSLKK